MDFLLNSDTWRYGSVIISLLTVFHLGLALRLYGAEELSPQWRLVLRMVTVQQAALAYLAYVRAKSTPHNFPQVVDIGLLILVLSGLAVLAAVMGIFAGKHGVPIRRSASSPRSSSQRSSSPPSS